MQIHELTKRQQELEEGILDNVKAAVRATKVGYKAGGLGGVASALTDPKQFARAQNKVYKANANKNLADIQQKMNKGKKEGDAGYWYKPGDAGYEAQQAAKQLAKNPKATQKVNQYTDAFQKTFGPDIQYQTNPDAAEKVAPVEPVKSNGYNSQTQQNIAAQNRQMGPLSGIREAPEYTSPGGIAIPAGAKTAGPAAGSSDHLPLTKFSQWADAKIPELKGAEQDPDLKPDVDAIEKSTDVKQAAPIFKKLLAKAFSSGGQGNTPSTAGTRNGKGMPPNDFITLIKQAGVDGLVKQLQRDKPSQPSGSDTLDAFLRAERLLAEELKAFKAGK
jgi:hypothetical protein